MINGKLTKIRNFLKSEVFKVLLFLTIDDIMYAALIILGFTVNDKFAIGMSCAGVPIVIAVNVGILIWLFIRLFNKLWD